MKKAWLFIFLILNLHTFFGQEILANVNVDFSQIQTSNKSRFQALEKSLNTFINTTRWTNLNVQTHEKIQANFILVIQEELAGNSYKANLLVQSRRPIYHSDYKSPVVNINDKDFTFKYVDFQPLIFNEKKFSGNNLTDVIAYYIYYIIGQDADTFKFKGGDNFYKISQNIVANAQSKNYSGWSRKDGSRNRYTLINETLSSENEPIREFLYSYHRKGLDNMYSNLSRSKNNLGESILILNKLVANNNYTQNYFLDNMMYAKKDEFIAIFSGGEPTTLSIPKLKTLLNKIAPTYSDDWNKLNK